jgi:formylglycine-generating enzyme required for sulfatase activity
VGGKLPNAFGLHDMHGNVWEWCWDSYDKNDYQRLPSPVEDPFGPSRAASDRVIRGGSWNYDPQFAWAANRFSRAPGSRNFDLGLRVARVR